MKELESLAARLGVAGQVDFRGSVTEEELRRAYAGADIFAMVSRQTEGYVEGFGLTFLEAAATGLPAVAGRSGGIVDAVLDRETGILVDPNSPDEIARAVCELLARPDFRAEMGRRARSRAQQQFRWEHVVSRMTGLFEEGRVEVCL